MYRGAPTACGRVLQALGHVGFGDNSQMVRAGLQHSVDRGSGTPPVVCRYSRKHPTSVRAPGAIAEKRAKRLAGS